MHEDMIDADRENNDIEVELTLLTSEEGGRKKGFPMQFTGPHVYFDGTESEVRVWSNSSKKSFWTPVATYG